MVDTAELTRPIIGIENRTAQEVFDIMVDRIRSLEAPADRVEKLEAALRDARYWIYREEAPDFARNFETLDHVPEGEGKEFLKRLDALLTERAQS